jgi:hypothetical protein
LDGVLRPGLARAGARWASGRASACPEAGTPRPRAAHRTHRPPTSPLRSTSTPRVRPAPFRLIGVRWTRASRRSAPHRLWLRFWRGRHFVSFGHRGNGGFKAAPSGSSSFGLAVAKRRRALQSFVFGLRYGSVSPRSFSDWALRSSPRLSPLHPSHSSMGFGGPLLSRAQAKPYPVAPARPLACRRPRSAHFGDRISSTGGVRCRVVSVDRAVGPKNPGSDPCPRRGSRYGGDGRVLDGRSGRLF